MVRYAFAALRGSDPPLTILAGTQTRRPDPSLAELTQRQRAADRLDRAVFRYERIAYQLIRDGEAAILDEEVSGMRSHLRDTCLIGQGPFTPGRPYLKSDCVWDRTLLLWQVAVTHVPPGEPPAPASEHWRAQDTRGLVTGRGPAPEGSGYEVNFSWAFRQDEIVYYPTGSGGSDGRITGLTDNQLKDAFTRLPPIAEVVFEQELSEQHTFDSCPVTAYPDARAWLADTPLMIALRAEAAQRHGQFRDRRQRHTGRRASVGEQGGGAFSRGV